MSPDEMSPDETSPDEMTEALLVARGLTAGYGAVPVVHDLTIEVSAGEVVVLLGPNGAGKTTTLLALAGEVPVSAGTVELFGRPARGRLDRRVRDGLAFVPEERGIFRRLSVGENLRLGRGALGTAYELAPELTEIKRRRAGLLSGGEQQILALARAIAARPKVLLADELSLGLAPLVVERMLAAVRRAADEGAAVLLVEQHAHQVLEIADRGYVLRRGTIELRGSATELAARVDELERAYLHG
jgi:branched-chain amino acid transport system ATP-binding protein